MTVVLHDSRTSSLGEGPLWHPTRKQLFWVDILNQKLMNWNGKDELEWPFQTHISAVGWVDEDHLLIASSDELFRFGLRDGSQDRIVPLEAQNTGTRSNDGRADPWGGFWIGTMGLNAEPGAGAIYRYYEGALRQLFAGITISNAICFAPDRTCAYFADTPTRQVMRIPLGHTGWPDGAPRCFIDLTRDKLNPVGAVVDAEGHLWIAQWGAARVARYDPTGRFCRAVVLPAQHVTCPAFGGPGLSTLYVTSALQGIPDELVSHAPQQGMTFSVEPGVTGLPEPRVLL